MKRFSVYFLSFMAICLMLASCGEESFLDRRTIYRMGNLKANVSVDIDWLTDFRHQPSGMSVYTFSDSLGMQGEVTNNVNTIDLQRQRGNYRLLIYNLTPSEFGSLDFYDMYDLDKARVKLTPITQYKNQKGWDEGITYQREPEDFGVALDTLEITQDMVTSTYLQTLTDYDCPECNDTVAFVYREMPKAVNTQLEVRVRVFGINNMKSVVGNIDQFPDGYYIGKQHSTSTEGMHLFDNFKASLDSTGAKNGWITTTISTFGLPWGKQEMENRDSTYNRLSLCFTLRDGRLMVFNYNVGDLVKYVERSRAGYVLSNHVTLQLLLVLDADVRAEDSLPHLPDAQGEGGVDSNASGFIAEVDDWEDGGTVDVGL